MNTSASPVRDVVRPLDFERLIVRDPAVNAAIRLEYATTYYRPEDADFLATSLGQGDLDFNTFTRYNQSVRHALPWVSRYFPLAGKRILEIGCGTGSSTAAFAQVAASVHTCDVNARALPTAHERLRQMNITNVTIDAVGAPEFMSLAREKYHRTFDAVLLFAVLEHQTLHERIETLRQYWNLLEPGGALVVLETPNRLTYWDSHTSRLPFYGMLPPEMSVKCVPTTLSDSFRMSMASVAGGTRDEQELMLTRWGRGISYHDVDLAIPRSEYTIVADGYEREIVDLFSVNYDERLLQSYVSAEKMDLSPAFCRSVLFMILLKDGGTGLAPVRSFSPMVASIDELSKLRDNLGGMTTDEIRRHLDHAIHNGTGFNYRPLPHSA